MHNVQECILSLMKCWDMVSSIPFQQMPFPENELREEVYLQPVHEAVVNEAEERLNDSIDLHETARLLLL